MPVFLAAMISEALLATGDLADKLWINERWHWKLFIDVSIHPSYRLTMDLSIELANIYHKDPTHLSTTLLPYTPSFPHNSSRSAFHSSSGTEVRPRRRPPLQRRLGRRCTTVCPFEHQRQIKNPVLQSAPSYPPGDACRSEHHLRPHKGGA